MPERVSIKLKGKGWNLIPISIKPDLKYFVASGKRRRTARSLFAKQHLRK